MKKLGFCLRRAELRALQGHHSTTVFVGTAAGGTDTRWRQESRRTSSSTTVSWGLRVRGFSFPHPPPSLFQLNTHLAGAHGAYDKVRRRGASEPADHPGRTRGVRQSALLLCFWVSGFKSQPKRGPPKKGKLGFCLRSDKRLVFLPRGGQAFWLAGGGGGLRTEKGIRRILVQIFGT